MKSHSPFAFRHARPVARAFLQIGLLLGGGAAGAQAAAPAESGDDVTAELIQLLTESGAIKPVDAARLIDKMKAQIAARRTAAAPVTAAAGWGTPPAGGPVDARGGVRVTYVPESEKQRIREEIKRDVLAQAQAENWAQPNSFPEWTRRIRLDGDLRLRGEADGFDDSNAPFINFQAINAGNPFNTAAQSAAPPPYLDTTENRTQLRLRARLGITADLGDGLDASLRLATGNSTNPVSTNQTLGSDFNKLTFTLDRAYLAYKPVEALSAWAGRLPNPWLSTPLVWDEDLNFDGAAVRYQATAGNGVKPFVTVGAFSVYNTAFDFPSTGSAKAKSRDKWLFAAQAGVNWKLGSASTLDAGLAYYHYQKIEGQSSSPCLAAQASDACDSDISRPGFVQKGNTLYGIRDLLVDSSQTAPPQYQYFGLASRFHLLDLAARYDWALADGNHFVFTGDIVRNLAYNAGSAQKLGPVNNFNADGGYEGGRNGVLLNASYGMPTISAPWQWNASLGYRYLQSDAVVDAFTDSDFHLGGTNAKGYTLQGSLGLTRNSWLTLRWLSATEISGPPLAIDVFHVDLNARF